jgi:hypothetical protein
VWIEYDCRGRRARKWFRNGLAPEARSFFKHKLKQGKNPEVKTATPQPPRS